MSEMARECMRNAVYSWKLAQKERNDMQKKAEKCELKFRNVETG
jgi:hypothetical protein